jgi:hypothetical protein
MIDAIAKKLDLSLDPNDMVMLDQALGAVCVFKCQEPDSRPAQKDAELLMQLFQSGIRNRHQLVAMLTGRRFP